MGHSTESALLRAVNDLRIIKDSGNSTALILLDLSAAFVDYNRSWDTPKVFITFSWDPWVGFKVVQVLSCE